MHKHCNIISKYFSLLSNHTQDVNKFSKQINHWIESELNDLHYEALTDDIFKQELVTFPKKIIQIANKIRNSTNCYLEELHLLANALKLSMKVEEYKNN